ncbi:DNA-binding protein [Candidatus Methylacidiphilum infernorum]|uniref:DNA-binding protein n=2 Tax=Candidatus Methylacidiphilum infernorum TaxID=511746 RepID=A0ABX7PVG0_9BACT|nr:DNA-binding protein [Candidatus Methylacidiphilum infernorum]
MLLLIYCIFMHPSLPRLLKLQQMDQKIFESRQFLVRIPREIEQVQKQLKAEQELVSRYKKELLQIELSIKELEEEIAGIKSKINQYKLQQLSTRKNEEYQALSHQIVSAESKVSALEDKILELLDKKEMLSKTFKEQESKFHRFSDEINGKIENLLIQKKMLEKNLDQLLEERKNYASGFDQQLLQNYQRIAAAKPGSAIVPVTEESCGGCHMKMTKQTYLKVKSSEELVFCEYCGRILFFPQ